MVYVGRRGRRRTRKKVKRPWLSVCVWTLVLVVALTLAFPKTAKNVRQRIAGALGIDFGGAISVFGENLKAGKNIIAAAKGAVEYAFRADDGNDMEVGDTDGNGKPAMGDASGEGQPSEAPEGNGENSAENAVEQFKESQSGYAELGLPGNVTFEMPEVPYPLRTPVSGTVTSGFGYREHPTDGVVRFHYGLDIAAETGTDAVSIADGTVAAVGDSTSYGLYVIVRHSNGVESLYAHLAEVSVENGDEVKAGDKIGTVGKTGNATAPCLHLELLVDGDYVNPGYYLYV